MHVLHKYTHIRVHGFSKCNSINIVVWVFNHTVRVLYEKISRFAIFLTSTIHFEIISNSKNTFCNSLFKQTRFVLRVGDVLELILVSTFSLLKSCCKNYSNWYSFALRIWGYWSWNFIICTLVYLSINRFDFWISYFSSESVRRIFS